jgi:hypothetical protein
MRPNELKCRLFKEEPLDPGDYAERLYGLLDSWRFRPRKFNEFEPLRCSWDDRNKFIELCHSNGKRNFGILIIKWAKPSFYSHVVSQYGPAVKDHYLSIYAAKLRDFGGERAPYLLELADQLFETLEFDYGFACLDAEYHAVNINLNVQIDENTVQPKQVVGMEWPDCVPGLYWCNYFGSVYFEQGFSQRIDEAAYVHRLSNGVRLLRSPSVLDWDTPEAHAESQRLMDLLGRDWFFTKSSGMPPKCLRTDKSLFAKRPS